MIGLSLIDARCSMILDIADRLAIWWTFFRSVQSRPAFSRRGLIQPAFIKVGSISMNKLGNIQWRGLSWQSIRPSRMS